MSNLPTRRADVVEVDGAFAISSHSLRPLVGPTPMPLGQLVGLPYPVLLAEARRTIAQHITPVAVGQGRPDPHARWRDLVRPAPAEGKGEPTTYRRSRCRHCQGDSCVLLDAAQVFAEVVGPYVAAEKADP